MTAQSRPTLKGYFNTDDHPTEAQFSDVIDSAALLSELTTHETDATAHGLTAGISAALAGATSPGAGNVFITDSAVDALIANQSYEAVSIPTGFTYTPPFSIERLGRSFRPANNWDISALAPRGKAYHVDVVNGNDANTGLSWAQAFKKIETAIAQADSVEVHVAAGVYGWVNGWHSVTVPGRSISIIGHGNVIIDAAIETLSWSVNGTYADVYEATDNDVSSVVDLASADDDKRMVRVASVALVHGLPGSWYWNGATVYVHTFNGRAPDGNVRVSKDLGTIYIVRDSVTVYFENCKIWGGGRAWARSNSATGGLNVYFKNCEFKHMAYNGLEAEGPAVCGLQDCVSAYNGQDGYNYHARNGIVTDAFEINCDAHDNGYFGESDDNASSIHDGGRIVRVGGRYANTTGPVLVDIDAALAWCLGCAAENSKSNAADSNRCNYFISGTMWLDRCSSKMSVYDLNCAAASFLHTRSILSEGHNTGAGTIDTY
jgi:hypothetical protein